MPHKVKEFSNSRILSDCISIALANEAKHFYQGNLLGLRILYVAFLSNSAAGKIESLLIC